MKKWYRKPLIKTVLVLLAIASVTMLMISTVLLAAFSGNLFQKETWSLNKPEYEESADFQNAMENAIYTILDQQYWKENFETDGKYDEKKIVDIMEYAEEGTISGENESKVAYYLGDLYDWGKKYVNSSDPLYTETGVIVCEKPEGGYYYYYLDEFMEMTEAGAIRIVSDGEPLGEVLEELKNGYRTSPGYGEIRVEDSEGKVLYTDCWNFGSSLKEEYAPIGAENLLDIVNETPALNGRLTDIYQMLDNALYTLYSPLYTYLNNSEVYEEGNTNFTYMYVKTDTKQVFTNRAEYQDYAQAEKHIEEMMAAENNKYVVIYPKLVDFQTNTAISAGTYHDMAEHYIGDGAKDDNFVFAAWVDTDFPIQDEFYNLKKSYEQNLPYLKASLLLEIAAVSGLILSLVWLTCIAGRRAEDEEVHLNGFDRWKTEIAAAVVIGIWLGFTALLSSAWTGISSMNYYYPDNVYNHGPYVYFSGLSTIYADTGDVIVLSIYGFITGCCFLAGYLSLVRRIKARSLWKDSLLRLMIKFLALFWRNRSVTWREVVALAGLFALHFMCVATGWHPFFVIPAIAADLAVIYYVVTNAVAKNRLKKGIEKIASGDLNYQISTQGLRGVNRELAERVNDIGNGLNRAVEESVKSERLKTDLITNVSHDIKTPLTSIINYVDLLKRENFQDEKIRGYLEILEAKAQRLKILTEDVVEASKVSSGNISLELMNVDLVEMVQQTEGEFEEKFAARNLTMITTLPEEKAVVYADGRRLWRVLENIFGNAAKYAMPGTRVYADLMTDEKHVRFSLKNISEQQLNISADELTERFIRGDLSRSTEGSGLGLSIAQSLTKLQGGEMNLYLDGDLFKVEVIFPKAE